MRIPIFIGFAFCILSGEIPFLSSTSTTSPLGNVYLLGFGILLLFIFSADVCFKSKKLLKVGPISTPRSRHWQTYLLVQPNGQIDWSFWFNGIGCSRAVHLILRYTMIWKCFYMCHFLFTGSIQALTFSGCFTLPPGFSNPNDVTKLGWGERWDFEQLSLQFCVNHCTNKQKKYAAVMTVRISTDSLSAQTVLHRCWLLKSRALTPTQNGVSS